MNKKAQFNTIITLIIVIIAILLIVAAIYLFWGGVETHAKLPEPGALVAIPLFLKSKA
ncbi:hypothetical protein GF374_02815 [Candidatus Woesearchaeota archaeon]|nr:hypothetical protein [Candidatus Woesearchaeota archaeon]